MDNNRERINWDQSSAISTIFYRTRVDILNRIHQSAAKLRSTSVCSSLLITTAFLLFINATSAFVVRDSSSGRNLVDTNTNEAVILRGVNLDGGQWSVLDDENGNPNPAGAWTLDDDYPGSATPAVEVFPEFYTEDAFAEMAQMGMNAVRLNLSYLLFEERDVPGVYRQEGWDFLDSRIAWAQNHNLLLILAMVVPPGGWQPSGGAGAELWDIPANQDRLINLWQEIARRYQNEETIAAYDILNEPVPTSAIDENTHQWRTLAQNIVNAIRADAQGPVDPNHLIIVEAVNGIQDAQGYSPWPLDDSNFLFLVDDLDDGTHDNDNIMYDFHFYSPMDFTHQQVPYWNAYPNPAVYPDANITYWPDDLQWADYSTTQPVPTGTTAWQSYTGLPYSVSSANIITAYPELYAQNNTGTVYYDNYVVTEYDSSGNLIGEVMRLDFSSLSGWVSWGNGTFTAEPQGNGDNASLSIANVQGGGSWYNPDLRFEVRQGHSYVVSGDMMGEDIGGTPWCSVQLSFEQSLSGTPVMNRDRNYLEYHVTRWAQFGIDNNVPMNIGEFGPSRASFENNLGGITYLQDLMDIMVENNLHFTYYSHGLWDYDYDGSYAPIPSLQTFLTTYYQNLP